MKTTSEAAFETAIEAVLLGGGYARVEGKGFDRERAIFPDEALAFIRATQGKVWEKLEALHGEQTGARVLESLCKWLDTHGALAILAGYRDLAAGRIFASSGNFKADMAALDELLMRPKNEGE